MSTKLVYDIETGEQVEHDLTDAEIAQRSADTLAYTTQAAAEEAADQDIRDRRQTLAADIQAMRDATTLAAFRTPLIRVLVFILRRLSEQAS